MSDLARPRPTLTLKLLQSLLAVLVVFSLAALPSCSSESKPSGSNVEQARTAQPQAEEAEIPSSGDREGEIEPFTLDDIPEYAGSPYVEINGGIPSFTDEEKSRSSFEEYAPLDALSRCGTAFALVGPETMPAEERESIGQVRPSGWQLVKYDCVDGKYLFNRCHLIGYQLAGENANVCNLITGTRYLNVTGMLPFEDKVAAYVESTGNHVLFRVTPVFEGDELVARGVHMEALSVEDGGAGLSFNVYCYNVQPGINIDYATGESWLMEEAPTDDNAASSAVGDQHDYVLNANTKRFHYPDCSSVSDMKKKSKQTYSGTRSDLIDQGYSPCGRCNP